MPKKEIYSIYDEVYNVYTPEDETNVVLYPASPSSEGEAGYNEVKRIAKKLKITPDVLMKRLDDDHERIPFED